MKLNLGCSDDLRPGWLNCDIAPPDQLEPIGLQTAIEAGIAVDLLPKGTAAYKNRAGRPCVFLPVDLAAPWPFASGSIEAVYAHDVFEHVGHCQHHGRQICATCYGSADAMPETRRGRASGCHICGTMPCVCTVRAFNGKVHVMNEAHRVLQAGGILDIAVPCAHLVDGRLNPGAFADPTHQTFWVWDDVFYYARQFAHPDGERGRLGPAYEITAMFDFPPLVQLPDSTWKVDPTYRGTLVWRITEQASGKRTKLVGILEAY